MVKRAFARIYFEPRGHRWCGGVFVELECAHVIVVPPGHRVDKRHDCGRCAELARVTAMLDRYFELRPVMKRTDS